MPLRSRLSSLWRNLLHKNRVEQELSAELQSYLELLIDAKLKEGMPPEAARRAALLELGGMEQVKEQVRDVRTGHYLEMIWRDLSYGLRVLMKNPGFTLIVLLTLTISIGANTAIFSVVDAALLRPLAFREPKQLVKVWVQKVQTSVSKAEFVEVKNNSQSFDDMAAYSGWAFSLTGDTEPAKLRGARVTASFFSVLGVNAALGRTFLPEEDQPSHNHVVMLGAGLWQSRYGADPNIIGQSITIDGESYTVVGVLPANFKFPDNGISPFALDLIVPAPLDPANRDDYTAGYLNVIGRLRPGVSFEQARAEVSSIAQNAREKLLRRLDTYGQNAAVVPLQKELIGDTRSMLYLLLGAVLFVLLIACANLANLQLARTTARRREIAIRLALGASRKRVVGQLLTESVTLALLGGTLGVLLAVRGVPLLAALLPVEIPRVNAFGVDFRVLSFSLALSVFTGILFGLAPALLSTRTDLQGALKEGGRKATGQAGDRLRRLLVVAEVALSLMLLVGAGLLIKSFWHLLQVDPGFKAENVLSFQIAPPSTNYSKPERKRIFYHQVVERIAGLPGVSAVGGIHLLPMGGNNWNPDLRVEDDPQPPGASLPLVDWRLVTPDYFEALGIRLIRGRFFTAADNENAPKVAIINETLARRYWGDADPIGKRLNCGFDGKDWIPIVGVVGDVKEQGLDLPTHLELYRPYDQAPFPSSLTLMVRSSIDPTTLIAGIREEVRSVDHNVPIADVQPLGEVVSQATAARRSTMLLLVGFAVIALALGVVGIYGVMSYAVNQQTHEIGIRMALGAQVRDVLKLVLQQGMVLVVVGIALGLLGAFSLSRLLTSLLFVVSPTDVLTFAGVALLLMAVALLACYIPSRRATKIDPMIALRYE